GITLIPAGQVPGLESSLRQDARGRVAAQADLAEDPYRLGRIELVQSSAQFVDRYIDRARDGADQMLVFRTDVDELGIGGIEALPFIKRPYVRVPVQDVLRDVARHVHGILGR